ncbi:penicillin-binding protein 2 [Thiovibrio sp. JS02]
MPRPLAKINKIDPAELKMLKKRLDIATAIITFFIAILVSRLWFLQIHSGTDYAKMSESNRIRIQDIAAPRGNILDRNGKTIITNRPRFNVVWSREDAPNPDEVIKTLAKILDEDISVLLERIRAAADHPRYVPTRLKEDIDWKTLVTIENNHFNLPGVRIEVLPSRDYLYGDFASHTIGYLGEISPAELEEPRYANHQSGDQIGKLGVEKLYEETLKGEKGRHYLEVDVHGFEQRQINLQEPLPGNDLQLTLDIDLQNAAEKAMEGKAGAVVVMEANTGRLLVLCSTPPLRLQEFVGGISSKAWNALLNDPLNPLINKTIQGQYPPGSTFKIVTGLAALSEGVVTPDTVFYCTGSINFGNRRYGCWKKGGHGPVNFHRALVESCDVYFYQVGQKLGVDTIARYGQSMGLGRKTGIDLEHEKSGIAPTAAWKQQRFKEAWQEGETLSVAIGQGFNLTTPLQICQMTAALVNGGVLYRPQLIQTVMDPEGKPVSTFAPEVYGKALGSERARTLVREALVDVVNSKSGTAKVVKLDNVLVGGKTGTAQVIRLSHIEGLREQAIPYKYRDHAWFTCFAPAEKPEIAVTVLVEHGLHGGSGAGPIAKTVLARYFEQKYGVPAAENAASPTPATSEPEQQGD